MLRQYKIILLVGDVNGLNDSRRAGERSEPESPRSGRASYERILRS